MPKPFPTYDYDDAVNLIGATVQLPRDGTRDFPLPPLLQSLTSSTVERNLRRSSSAISATEFYAGNHWQSSRGFIGQLPPAKLPGSAQIQADIANAFVSENVIKEVVNTHVGGILGREPSWSFLPAAAQTTADRDQETGDTLTPWWNKRKGLKDLQKALRIALCEGIAVRRLFLPRVINGQPVTPGTRITARDLATALDSIYFETTTADRGGVFTDPDTQQQIGVFLYEEHDDNGDISANCAELSFLNSDGDTVCRIVRDEGAPTDVGVYQLGGHLLVYQIELEQMITDQVQASQKSVNLAHTMMMRNVNLAGHRGVTVTNAQPPKPATDKVSVTAETTKVAGRFPGTFKAGVGAVNFLMGVPIYSDDGETIVGYTNPNVNVMEPVSVDSFQKTISEEKEAIYSQCHQRHVLIVDKADTSGRAREVARKEYERSLKASKTELDACGRWQLEATLRLAAQMINQSAKYLKLRADFNCLVDAGVPDPAFIQQVLEMRKPSGPRLQPIISDETARNLCGVEDAAAELARIQNEAAQPPADPTPLPKIEPAGTPANGTGTPTATSGAVN
jgi:hypothetical protein